MENDPNQLRQEQTAPLLAADAQIEYYDTRALDWLPKEGRIRSAAETLYPYAQKALRNMDWLGGKLANGLGLTSSRFQYAVDEYDRRERRFNEREARERQKERELARQAGAIDDEDSKMPYVPPVQLSFLESNTSNTAKSSSQNNNNKDKSNTKADDEKKKQKKNAAGDNDDDEEEDGAKDL